MAQPAILAVTLRVKLINFIEWHRQAYRECMCDIFITASVNFHHGRRLARRRRYRSYYRRRRYRRCRRLLNFHIKNTEVFTKWNTAALGEGYISYIIRRVISAFVNFFSLSRYTIFVIILTFAAIFHENINNIIMKYILIIYLMRNDQIRCLALSSNESHHRAQHF